MASSGPLAREAGKARGVQGRIAVLAPGLCALRLLKWKVREGRVVGAGSTLCLAEPASGSGGLVRVRAPRGGAVRELRAEGDTVQPGECIAEVEECQHPTVMKEMCAECGADLRTDAQPASGAAVVPMIHSVPELKVSEELAKKLGGEDSDRLLRDRKLVLLVDLDQTLVHTTNENVPPNLQGVSHYWLRGPGGGRWYHTRLRPGTRRFLQAAAAHYELHVCTFGARQYAHAVARVLDPAGQYFSHRILSRDECFDARAKAANLKALFPCGDNLVCIIDDREDVWRHATNLIHVRPYNFFKNTGDINAPPQADEKSRLISGKNGSQLQPNPEMEMPCLDPDPDLKESKKERISGVVPVVVNNSVKDKGGNNGKVTGKTELRPAETNIIAKDAEITVNDADKTAKDPQIIAKVTDKTVKDTQTTKHTDKTVHDTVTGKVTDQTVNDTEIIAIVTDITVKDAKVSVTDKAFKSTDVTAKDTDASQTENDTDNNKKELIEVDLEQDANDDAMETGDQTEVEGSREEKEPKWTETADGQIDVEDPDDYLIYLEDILQRIHTYFYELYDKMESGQVPDLKTVIPEVKSQVLAGTSLVFSGLVPTQQRLEGSRAFLVARSLGAKVTQDFTESTTHLVAVRPGTAKVNWGRRAAGERPGRLHVVTPAWLWSCAERWERVDERLYPLQRVQRTSARRPPAHCSSPPPPPPPPAPPAATLRRRTPSGRFMDTLNPLLSFSSADIADMDREVEDILDDESESSSSESELAEARDDDMDDEENPPEERLLADDTNSGDQRLQDDLQGSSSNDSGDSLPGESEARPHKRQRTSSPPPSDGEEPPDEDNWNLMGEALEREFLGLD